MAFALGVSVEEALGSPFPRLLVADSPRISVLDIVNRVATTGVAMKSSVELRGSDGAPIALLVRAEPVNAPTAADTPWVRLTELESCDGVDSLVMPLHVAASLAGTMAWVYSPQDQIVECLGDFPVGAGLPTSGPIGIEELLARVHEQDVLEVRRLVTSPSARTGTNSWLQFRFRGVDGRWLRLSSRSRSVRQGLEGQEYVIGAIRQDHTSAHGREQLVDELRKERERATRVADIAALLIAATTEEEFSRVIVGGVAAAFGGTGTLLAFAENGRLRIPSGLGFDPRYMESMNGLPLTTPRPLPYAIRTGQPVFLGSREEFLDQWPAGQEFLDFFDTRSGSVVPFGTGQHAAGGWVITYDKEFCPSTAHRTLMRTLAYLAGQALERIRLHQSRLELVRVMQKSMLPPRLVDVPGLEVAGRYAPARHGLEVGGDWYDAFPMADGTVALVIGDVQGHDVEAAAFMGQVRTSIRSFASAESDPGTVLTRTNDLLVGMAARTFASCIFLSYRPEDGTVLAARAGHVPLIWAGYDGSHGVREIEGGTVLGVLAGEEYPTQSFILQPNSVLALITDGVVEGPAQPLEEGLERVSALAAEALREGVSTEEAADRLLAAAGFVGHEDDAAVLIARRL